MTNKIKSFWVVIVIALFGVLVFFDQYTKQLAVSRLKGGDPFVILEGIFEFRYHENEGAAWGMLQGAQGIFFVLTSVFTIIVIYEIKRLWCNMRYLPFILNLVLVLSGAIGNFIDRLSFQYVRDFIYVKAINFPIFNIADSYITISVAILILMTFFYYTEEEFDFILPFGTKKVKKEE
ncbi:MAG: signal peptidase II [Lachnospiraceae bacterium]